MREGRRYAWGCDLAKSGKGSDRRKVDMIKRASKGGGRESLQNATVTDMGGRKGGAGRSWIRRYSGLDWRIKKMHTDAYRGRVQLGTTGVGCIASLYFDSFRGGSL